MTEETSQPSKGLVSDNLFGVSSKSTHSVLRSRVCFLIVVRDINQIGTELWCWSAGHVGKTAAQHGISQYWRLEKVRL